jgi:hypothetical protein
MDVILPADSAQFFVGNPIPLQDPIVNPFGEVRLQESREGFVPVPAKRVPRAEVVFLQFFAVKDGDQIILLPLADGSKNNFINNGIFDKELNKKGKFDGLENGRIIRMRGKKLWRNR